MAWDWEKLNQQQQKNGPPPQMDELLKQVKNIKLPGGSLLIGIIVVLAIITCLLILIHH